jgi:sulfatase-like protein
MKGAATLATVMARLTGAAFFLLTAIYALLVYLPFSYQQFILPNVAPGLSTFVAWHPVVFWGVLLAIAASSTRDLRNSTTRVPTAVYLLAGALAGAWLTYRPLLAGLRSDRSSLVVCLLSLAPVLWIAGLDALSGRGLIVWRDEDDGEDRRVFDAAVCAALFVSLTYFAIAAARASSFPMRDLSTVLVWSVTAHLVLFGALFLALLALRGAVKLAGGSAFHEALLLFVFATALATLVFKQIVFAAISFTGPAATAVALGFAASIAGLVAGVIVRLRSLPVRTLRWTRWRRVVSLTAIAATAWFLSARLPMMDWNSLLQKMSAIAIWIAAFAALYVGRGTVPRPAARTAIVWLLLAAAVPAVSYRVLAMTEDRGIRSILDAHAGSDPSFKVLHDIVSATATGDEREFYDLLQRNTNIPRAVRVDPVAVDLVKALGPRTGHAPHIFMFVIDSLRQDYVSPYNTRVTFTPAIDAFARDGVVFKRAFTRYGATGLSEPSIWVGGLLVHKQYVMPFAPMNALHKLLAADGYQRFISRDTILRTIMPADETDVDLDSGVQNMDYDLCRSLTDLRAKVRGRSGSDRPIFAYTQPQSIHISVITREGGSYGSSLQSRIQKLDACFGEFVQFLRDEGLYDDSLIVLTSDHGDSLGEGGRWGHAYTIFPEVVRIPLIVHLPRAWREQVTCDTDAVASLVDITPTLYYLLGHRPVVSGAIFGRPLCTATPQERMATRRDSYLIGSSYGPVYGILRGNGRWLYIADGVNYTDYYYDLASDPAGSDNLVTPAIRGEYQPLIREGIAQINRFYRK